MRVGVGVPKPIKHALPKTMTQEGTSHATYSNDDIDSDDTKVEDEKPSAVTSNCFLKVKGQMAKVVPCVFL
jgi:hypothetical protein